MGRNESVEDNVAKTPRAWHTEERLNSIGHALVHIAAMRATGRLSGIEPIMSAAGIRAFRRGNPRIHAAHISPASLNVLMTPLNDPRFDSDRKDPKQWTPLSDCWISDTNRKWTRSLSRDADLTSIIENRADSWKELNGEVRLFSEIARATSQEATGDLSIDIPHIQAIFMIEFLAGDLRIIERAIAGVTRKISASSPVDREPYELILKKLEDDRRYETNVTRGIEFPDALDRTFMRQTAEALIENESR